MLSPTQIPPVSSDEELARFVLFSKWIRNSDLSVKPDAFVPHPRTELSLTRHLQITIEELWREGKRVSEIRNVTLYGRADVTVLAFTERDLSVEPAPIKENPNHANVSNWPIEKSAQKMKAIEIALISQYIPKSNETN